MNSLIASTRSIDPNETDRLLHHAARGDQVAVRSLPEWYRERLRRMVALRPGYGKVYGWLHVALAERVRCELISMDTRLMHSLLASYASIRSLDSLP
jgi:predicted nucleic acid-binding protein